MSNVLSVDKISKSYGEKWLFNQITFGLEKGEKVAMVGANGTGKTTLLRTIVGLIPSDAGIIAMQKNTTLSYLPQEPELPANLTIMQTLFSADNVISATIKAYEKAIENPETDGDNFQFLMDEMTRLDAWDYDKKANQILSKLGITQTDVLNETLSGGQRKRVALAKILLEKPDLILMDEPTNHLDLEAIEWLENLLTAHQITLLMVTHDRYFLDNVCTKIIELDQGKLHVHEGNYAYFLEQKSLRMQIEKVVVEKAKNLLIKELEWMRRMPKARGTKSKSRITAYYDLKEIASQNIGGTELEIGVQASRLGNKVIEIHNISHGFKDLPIVKNFTFNFKRKDKIGVIGKNGIGKSTLLDLLTQKITPNKGEVIHGSTLQIGYYTQHINNLNLDNRIIDEVKEIAEFVSLGNGDQITVSKLLEMFLFPPKVQHTPIHKLSGGEKRRLQLLKVLVASPNFLILDEPTNDLDIDTLNVLEDFLFNFEGCLLLVSHDRYFMDNLVDQLLIFEGEGLIKNYHGNYTDYRENIVDVAEEKKVVAPKSAIETAKKQTQKTKLSYNEQREFEQLQIDIETIETLKTQLTLEMGNQISDFDMLNKLALQIEDCNIKIEKKTMRWLELSEIINV